MLMVCFTSQNKLFYLHDSYTGQIKAYLDYMK